jgi:hypothetical protein
MVDGYSVVNKMLGASRQAGSPLFGGENEGNAAGVAGLCLLQLLVAR